MVSSFLSFLADLSLPDDGVSGFLVGGRDGSMGLLGNNLLRCRGEGFP